MAKTGRANQIFKPEFHLGLGGVPLGNEFEVVTDEGAMKTMEASWSAGVRYFDVSPWYGLGLAERRYGAFLHKQQRDSYLISTKVGKLLKAAPRNNSKELFPYANSPNNVVFDYTADGVRRSLEDSLQRLGIDHIDVVFVHESPQIMCCYQADARRGRYQGVGHRREHPRADSSCDAGVRSRRVPARIAIFVDRPR